MQTEGIRRLLRRIQRREEGVADASTEHAVPQAILVDPLSPIESSQALLLADDVTQAEGFADTIGAATGRRPLVVVVNYPTGWKPALSEDEDPAGEGQAGVRGR